MPSHGSSNSKDSPTLFEIDYKCHDTCHINIRQRMGEKLYR